MGSGGINSNNRMPAVAVNSNGGIGAGDPIVGASLTSLLGLPPPQQTQFPQVYQENGFVLRNRNHQWPANPPISPSLIELHRRKSVCYFLLNALLSSMFCIVL